MAFLMNVRPRQVWLLAYVCALGGCSLLLDTDELDAELRDTVEETDLPETDDLADLGGETETSDDTSPVDLDSDLADTEPLDAEVADDSGPSEDTVEDSDDGDDTSPDDGWNDSASPDADADSGPDTDVEVLPTLDIRTSGGGNCILDFYLQAVTNCPKTCGWTVTFDAQASQGISSLSWRFTTTGGYLLTPETAVGMSAAVVVSTPACILFPAGSMRPAKVTASVSVDGGPWQPGADIPFTVRQVQVCGSSMCPAP